MDLVGLLEDKKRETCLSKPVSELFEDSINCSSQCEDFLFNDGTLNIAKIQSKFNPIYETENNDRIKYAKLVKLLSPTFSKSFEIFSATDLTDIDSFTWLTNVKDNFKLSIPLLQSQEENNIILANLIIVSCLERALGNLLLVKTANKWVPPLLKDLLSHPDLRELIGLPLIICLKAVIGPPSSLNARNLLWHGFVFPGELNPKLGYFLISLIKTIQCIVEMKKIECDDIPSRELTIYPDKEFIDYLPTLKEDDLDCMSMVISRSPVVFDKLVPLWRLTLKLFSEKRFGESAILIMYLMEASLRMIYAKVNDCSVRILSAQSHELYTTYSEILKEYLPNSVQDNKFIDYFPQSLLEMLFDLLFNQFGLRLRDRLSHGQVKLTGFPLSIAKYALVTAYCLIRYVDISLHTDEGEACNATNTLKNLFCKCLTHKSVAHMNGIVVMRCSTITNILETWDRENEMIEINQKVLLVKTYLDCAKVPTLFRPSNESTLVNHLHQIIQCFESSVQFYFNKYEDYQLESARGKLRQRQRENFEKMKKSTAKLYENFTEILYFLVSAHSTIIHSPDNFEGSIRLLNRTLQKVQNLKSHISNNKWDLAVWFTQEILSDVALISEKHGVINVVAQSES